MNFEQQLNIVAEGYRTRGFKIVVRPGPDDLPPFAKDFKVEILAAGPETNVLASAKANPAELEADANLPRYAEIIEKQPGWRFDLFLLGPSVELSKLDRHVSEPSEEDIRRMLDEVERILQAEFVPPSFAAAWGALEAAMRRRIRAGGGKADWATMPQTLLNELYSSGMISTTVLRELEKLFQVRNAIVHGFSTPPVDPSAVRFLIDTARRLLTESQPVKQTA